MTKRNNAAMRRLLVMAAVYATMLFFGLSENVKGVSFPLIKEQFGALYDQQGGLVSGTWFGYVISCFAASFLLSRLGSKRTVVLGYFVVGAGMTAVLFAPGFWTVAAALMLMNLGFGLFEIGGNALAMTAIDKHAAVAMNLMHFFYGFGAILGPKLAGVIVTHTGGGFRAPYLVLVFPVAAVGVYLAFLRVPAAKRNEAEETPAMTLLAAFKNPMVWLFSVTLGFMEVVEFGAANWGGLYLRDVLGMDVATAGANFVMAFYILFTAGRLLGGFVIERAGYLRSMFAMAAVTAVILAVGFLLGRSGVWVLPLSGLFIAGMWPTVMALAMRVFGPDAPVAASAVITLSGAVNGVFQFLTGVMNEHLGAGVGYPMGIVYALVICGLLVLIKRRTRTQT